MTLQYLPEIPLRTLQGFKLTTQQHDDIHKSPRTAINAIIDYLVNGSSTTNTPIGGLIPYAGGTIPDGWLWANGQVVSQTTYTNLYLAISTTFNTGGEGAGNFRVPNLNGRVLIGTNPMGGITDGTLSTRTLGVKYGAESNTQSHSHAVNITGSGTVTIPSQSVTVTVAGNTATGTTGSTTLSISGDSSTLHPTFVGTLFNVSYTPTGTVTAPGLGTLSAVTVANNTGTTSLSINGVGTVTSQTKSGVLAISNTCTPITTGEDGSVMNCGNLTVSPFTIGIDATAIATSLSISPNGHSHTIPALAVTLSGSLSAPTFTATNSLNQNVTPAGTVSIAANTIASALSISPNPHSHTIPSLAVTGTGTGTIESQDVDFVCAVVGSTDAASITVPLIQPSLALNYIIKY